MAPGTECTVKSLASAVFAAAGAFLANGTFGFLGIRDQRQQMADMADVQTHPWICKPNGHPFFPTLGAWPKKRDDGERRIKL